MAMSRRKRAAQAAAAAASIVNNGDGTLREIDETEGELASCYVLGQMIRRGDSDRTLLLKIAKCANQEALFYKLCSTHRGKKTWWAFVETVFLLPEEVWEKGGGSLEEELVRTLSSVDLLTRIANVNSKTKYEAHHRMRAAVTSKNHPLFKVLSFDEYWIARVRHFIKKRDVRRAWGELRAAYNGFRIADIEVDPESSPKLFWMDKRNLCCYASCEVLLQLVNELFDAMCRRHILKPLSEVDFSAPRDRIDGKKQRTVRGKLLNTPCSKENFWPGKDIALEVGRVHVSYQAHVGGGIVRSVSGPGRNAIQTRRFDEAAAKVHKMATYFNEKRARSRSSKKPSAKASSKQSSRSKRTG